MSEETSFNLFFRKPAYGTSHMYELARIGQATAGIDIPTRVIFDDKGIFCLIKNQQPSEIQNTPIINSLILMANYGAEVYVVKEALEEYTFTLSDLDENLPFKVIERADLAKLTSSAKFTIEV